MAPEPRFVCRFAAEPPQEGLPYGRWSERLQETFLAAVLELRSSEDAQDLGDPGEVVFYPDRTWNGRTYQPVTCGTTTGLELFGLVSWIPAWEEGDEPSDLRATADWTAETADANPEWTIDLCDEVIGGWRGENGNVAAITVVWGTPMRDGGHVVTAELADLAVDQCLLVERRFTLVAPDDYRGDTLDVKVFDQRNNQIAVESLYSDDDED
ncbi:hypothetical protein [Conexibacter sp. SYSU D00693]|uniref:hypothetical protein n=1 Tax=Conexibacter sp. SYSU D00693 TaxID=2812560 RepID=UPI00196AFA72|nr:hypothetical protein [Conexibacter sp. SYSU D00693]